MLLHGRTNLLSSFNASKVSQVGVYFRQLVLENEQHPLFLARKCFGFSFGLLLNFGLQRIQNVLRASQQFQNLHQLEQDIYLAEEEQRQFSCADSGAGRKTWEQKRIEALELACLVGFGL